MGGVSKFIAASICNDADSVRYRKKTPGQCPHILFYARRGNPSSLINIKRTNEISRFWPYIGPVLIFSQINLDIAGVLCYAISMDMPISADSCPGRHEN
jgi:hypothetical protein